MSIQSLFNIKNTLNVKFILNKTSMIKPKNIKIFKIVLSILFVLSTLNVSTSLQAQDQPEVAAPQSAESQNLILYVSNGKPDQGGTVHEFRLKNGSTAFIQLSQTDLSPKQTPQEAQEATAYKLQVAKISTEVAQKISNIQAKQKEIDNEVYIVHRAPLENEKRQLEQDLEVLQERRNQIQSQHTAKEALKPPPAPSKAPSIAQGLTIAPTVSGNTVNLSVSTQGDQPVQASIDAPLNNWVQVYGTQSGQEVWVKVEPAP